MSSIEMVTLVHKGGQGFGSIKNREISVPITAVRVHGKSGWEPKKGEDAKRVKAVESGDAPVTTA